MPKRDDRTSTPPHGDPLREEGTERHAAPPAGAASNTRSAPPASRKSGGYEPRAEPRADPEQRAAQHPTKMPAQHQEEPGIEAELRLKPQWEAPSYRAAGKLEGKVALITGGDSGIGRAVANLYAREGADVAIVYLPVEQQDADETRRAVERAGRRCLQIPGDVTDSAFCRDAVERVVQELGKLDILVNNAAHQKDKQAIDEIDDAEFDKTFKTNIYAYFHFAKAALKHMQAGASIINTGSITGLEGAKTLIDYSATKGAIHAFTKSLAQSLVERRIRVNCVAPGPVWTPLNPQSKPADEVAEFGQDTPYKRPGQPEEMAPAYVFFASTADSSYVTGEVLALLGGDTTAG
ncbi:MAG: SDR family oxidoreductase [Gemmatirosa sp.]|nr:SDR family oxidoreductase [Gemmatirosa sp.]